MLEWLGGLYRGECQTLVSTPTPPPPPPIVFSSQFLRWDIGGKIGEGAKHMFDAPNLSAISDAWVQRSHGSGSRRASEGASAMWEDKFCDLGVSGRTDSDVG